MYRKCDVHLLTSTNSQCPFGKYFPILLKKKKKKKKKSLADILRIMFKWYDLVTVRCVDTRPLTVVRGGHLWESFEDVNQSAWLAVRRAIVKLLDSAHVFLPSDFTSAVTTFGSILTWLSCLLSIQGSSTIYLGTHLGLHFCCCCCFRPVGGRCQRGTV